MLSKGIYVWVGTFAVDAAQQGWCPSLGTDSSVESFLQVSS